MKRILHIVILISILVGVMVILTGCENDNESSYIDEIYIYYGSTSLNSRYTLKNGTLYLEKQYGNKKSKNKKLNISQMEEVENIIKKYTLLENVEERNTENEIPEGGTDSYYTIILKDEKKEYHSAKEKGLTKELSEYFEDILD